MYKRQIQAKYDFITKDHPELKPLTTVRKEYLETAFRVIDEEFEGIESYLINNLEADIEKQMCIRDRLDFLLEEKYERKINLGIRFDSEEIASMLLNATLNLKTHIPSKVSVTGRLGKRYAARVDYTLEPMQMRNFNFGYLFEYNDILSLIHI